MKMIKISHPHHLAKQNVPKSVMALGFFDGVHKGHQKVIQTAKQKAEELNVECAVMTFDPHPSIVLKKYSTIRIYYSFTRETEVY